jgi:ABC-type antimicrobial peptide transport system permease subunit
MMEALTIVDANEDNIIISVDQGGTRQRYKEEQGVAFVNQDYFNIFPRQWISGNPKTALTEQKTVVLSESLARKYFGDQDPIGQVIRFSNQYDLKVTGLIKDHSAQTDLPFNMLISIDLGEEHKRGWEGWDATSGRVHCYLKLKDNHQATQLNLSLEDYFGKHWHEEHAKEVIMFLQPLKDVHFDNRFNNFNDRVISARTLWAMGIIGLSLLITSCINFVNISTALAANRSKEIGVRKVLGGARLQLVRQLMIETLLVTLIAVLVASVLVRLGLAQVTNILGYDLSLQMLDITDLLLFLIVLILVVCLLAGLYPALMISGFKPIQALKKSGFTQVSRAKISLRSSLVVVQLVISQILAICTLVVTSQLQYFIDAPIGINKDAIIEYPLPVRSSENVEKLAYLLSQSPAVRSLTFSNTGASSSDVWGGSFEFNDGQEKVEKSTQIKFIDENFIETYGIQLKAGQNLIKSDSATMFLVNESFVQKMGMEENQVLGQHVTFWGTDAPIVGILKNFNTTSLHDPIKACIFQVGAGSYFKGAIKVHGQNLDQAIEDLEAAWVSVYPEHLFEYSFLDETIERFYSEEKKLSQLFKLFVSLAIIIGAMGLFGLISFIASKRTKEIGVRKVLGADASSVVMLLSKHFVFLTFIAFLLAAPASYYLMQSWLANFSYQIELSPFVFIMGLALSLIIVLMTIGYQTMRAAQANPVDALRNE